MIDLKIRQNTFNLILISVIFIGSFFFQNSLISFKIIYAIQIVIIFYLLMKYSEIKIDRNILILNLAVLSIFFFKFDKSFIYLIFICLLNAIFALNNIKQVKLKNSLIYQLVFTLIMILCFKTSTYYENIYDELFLFEEILKNYHHYNACLEAEDLNKINNSTFSGSCEFQLKRLRYGFLNLHSNLTAIFCLIITFILLKNLDKKVFIFLYSAFGLLFLYLTLSKSGLLFFSIIIFLTVINLNYKILLLLFFVFNLFLGIISFNISSSVSDFWGKNSVIGQMAYQKEFCPKISKIPIIKYLNECEENRDLFIRKMNKNPEILILNFMGYSTFYKLHSYGMVVDNIINNPGYYLFPNPLHKLETKKIINKKDVTGKLSAHGLFFLVFVKYGIILGTIFLINLYFFVNKIREKKLFVAFIFSSMFLSLDIFLLFPFFLISMLLNPGYK